MAPNFAAPHAVFQSTLSVRRATRPAGQAFIVHGISIHALRKESDIQDLSQRTDTSHFNPRSP